VGIRISAGGKIILIDAVEDFSYYKPVIGDAMKDTLLFSDELKADYILFTHLHLDHFDKGLIQKCLKPAGKIIVYSGLVEKVRKQFEYESIISLDLDEVFIESAICFKPVFAMDGIGDIQSSWIVEYAGMKIFHGGDTIWHNQFWRLSKENPGIDYAFLPVNGVVVHFPMMGLEYSSVPASLTLEQAFTAARLLHVKKLVPIHYGLFAHGQYYIPTMFTEGDLERLSKETQQPYRILKDGAYL
jgi:L-ascorbate metabolism protein UlaG (beta-lactamase superfamily)